MPFSFILLKKWLPAFILIALMLIVYLSGLYESFTFSTLIKQRQTLIDMIETHFLLSLFAFMMLYICAVALSFPGASFLTIAGGFLFGWMLGGVTTIIGASLGAFIVFFIAQTSLGSFLKQKASKTIAPMAKGFQNNALSYMLFLRLVPAFPFWLVNIVPAFLNVRPSIFFIGTFFGIAPGSFAFAFIGSGLGALIQAQEAENPGCAAREDCDISVSALIQFELLIALGLLGCIALIPLLYKKFFGQNVSKAQH